MNRVICDLLAHDEIRKLLRPVYFRVSKKIQALEMMKIRKFSKVPEDDCVTFFNSQTHRLKWKVCYVKMQSIC